MGFGSAFSLLYIAVMMVVGFYLLFELFSRDRISGKLIFTIQFLLAYMGIATASASYIVFWNGNIIAGISAIAVSGLAFLFVLKAKSEDIEWRKNLIQVAVLVAALLVLEVSMGFFYASVFMEHNRNPFIMSINNLDFAFMMFADAAFFLLMAKKRKSTSEIALFTFAVSMAAMPDFYLQFHDAVILSATIISASVMAVNIVLLYVIQMRKKTRDMQILAVLLAGTDLLMMVGLSSYAIHGELFTITLTMVVSMVSYFFLVTYRFSNARVSNSFRYSFILLVLINSAELVMSFGVTSLGSKLSSVMYPSLGGVFANYLPGLSPGMVHNINFNSPVWWLFPFSPYMTGKMAFTMGMSVNPLFAYFWSSFMLLMATTMSPFYAIMMGSEMSYLVFERYRKSSKETVRKWAIAIIAGIPLFVIVIPFYTPLYIFGMSGMLFEIVFVGFLGSVIAVLAASALFGRRVQCNLVCMAAHMWTNSYYDQFKPKRNSTVWGYMRWFFFFLMILAFSLFMLQETGYMHPLKIGMITINPLDFYGMFVLNYVWWFFYFLTPVFGTYSCARQGWCGFGTLAGIFNKFFFRIRPVDAGLCQTCETGSCELSCPTAIPVKADMIQRGYSNRIACIGCANCVESCDKSNLFVTDVRNAFKNSKLTD